MAIDTISRALSGQASTAAKQAKETADSAMEQAISAVPGAVADWLEDNVTPTTPVVDASLSIAGAAADAKAAGDGIADLKRAFDRLGAIQNVKWIQGRLSSSGTHVASTYSIYTDLIPVTPGDEFFTKYLLFGQGNDTSPNYYWYNSSKAYVSDDKKGIAPTNAAYMRVQINTGTGTTITPENGVKYATIINYKSFIGNAYGGNIVYERTSTLKWLHCKDLPVSVGDKVFFCPFYWDGPDPVCFALYGYDSNNNSTLLKKVTTKGDYAVIEIKEEYAFLSISVVCDTPAVAATFKAVVAKVGYGSIPAISYSIGRKVQNALDQIGLVDTHWNQGSITSTGEIVSSTTTIYSDLIPISNNTVFRIAVNDPDVNYSGISFAYFYYDTSNTFISYNAQFVVPENAAYVRCRISGGLTPERGDEYISVLRLSNSLFGDLPWLSTSERNNMIVNGTDYDTLLTPGAYVFSNSVDTLVNVPSGVGRHALYVLHGSSRTTIHQLIIDNNGKFYYRYKLNNSSNFTAWQEIIKGNSVVTTPTLTWALNGYINGNGTISTTSLPYKISYPIKLYEGDSVSFTGSFVANDPAMVKYRDRWNTYWANTIGSSQLYMIPSSSGAQTLTATVPETGYYVFCANLTSGHENPTLTVARSYHQNLKVQNEESLTKWNYGIDDHNWVDDYDFVPDMTKQGIGMKTSPLIYQGDDKKSSNHIANAVAYPNGEIIACRAHSGQVVKIANDGTETVLLTIAGATDWRGVFMDSNLNVYVSPHSTLTSPSINPADRGLYRLAYGESSFSKVISLCRSTTDIKIWAANTAYAVGDKVFTDKVGTAACYTCKTAHTSGSSFDATNWTIAPSWKANTSYAIGDLVVYNNCYYWCNTAHTSGSAWSNNLLKFDAASEHMNNDDTIWTMCEDEKGYLYAGVYAHSIRSNAAIYRSMYGGYRNSWTYQHNFLSNGTLPASVYGSNAVRHVHCVNYNPYDNCLYAAVGEVNTICKSSNHGTTWTDLHAPSYYGQPTYVLGVKDGIVIGSDGHYACGVSKLKTDGKTMKLCGRTVPGFIFNIRRSDLTGWLYAFTRIDNITSTASKCPTIECVTDNAALENWKTNVADPQNLQYWTMYNEWASVHYPEDAIRPTSAVIMVSRDEGDTWEVIYRESAADNYCSFAGFITVGYFRDGECLVGFEKSKPNTENDIAYVQPLIISEGKKKRTSSGYDLTGEIFIKTNSSNSIAF